MRKLLSILGVTCLPLIALADAGASFQAGTDLVLRNLGGTVSYSFQGGASGTIRLAATPAFHAIKAANSLNAFIPLKTFGGPATAATVELDGSLSGENLTWTVNGGAMVGKTFQLTLRGTTYQFKVVSVSGNLNEKLTSLNAPVEDTFDNVFRGVALTGTGTHKITITGTVSGVTSELVFTPDLAGVAGTPVSQFVKSISLTNNMVEGGTTAMGTITLNQPASADETIALNWGGPITVPTSVTIKAGQATGTFNVQASAVTGETPAFVTANFGASMASASLKVTPILVSVISDGGVSLEGGNLAFRINLAAPAPKGGLKVDLFSDNPDISVPASVTIPAGYSSIVFMATSAVTTNPTENVTIEAAADGTIISSVFTLH